jgi:hypothetical protein
VVVRIDYRQIGIEYLLGGRFGKPGRVWSIDSPELSHWHEAPPKYPDDLAITFACDLR